MPRVSVVVVSYRRKENLGRIIPAWLSQTTDVWLCDCSREGIRYPDINYAYFYPDPGNKARHAVSLLTNGDFVIKADDDVLPKPGLIKDFLDHSYLGGILGLMGRTFLGPIYYGKTGVYRAREISIPQRVGMVGILTFTPRQYLAFDLKGCLTSVEDLFWQMKAYPEAKKYVIPTKAYEQLPESNDAGCLFKNKKARAEREVFYSKYFRMHYQ